MRVDRWVAAACLVLTLAIVPGGLRLVLRERLPVERAAVFVPGPTDPGLAAIGEVPITPPGELVGAMAVPIAPAPTFDPVSSAGTSGEVYALLIGIDDYPGTSADLRAGVADVDTVDAALDGFGVPDGNRVVLRDGQARRGDVVAAVQSLVRQGGPGATFVLGYAGHVRKLGPETEALVLADGEMLTDVELAALLAPATTQRMWLLLATCFAGGFTELLGPGRVLTGAADATQLAYETPAMNASYLVHYLVREGWLQGAAGRSVQDAYGYADAALAKDHPGRRPIQLDALGAPMLLGMGDPASAAGLAPPLPIPPPPPSPSPTSPAAPSPPPTSPPTTARPPEEEEQCFLGLVC